MCIILRVLRKQYNDFSQRSYAPMPPSKLGTFTFFKDYLCPPSCGHLAQFVGEIDINVNEQFLLLDQAPYQEKLNRPT